MSFFPIFAVIIMQIDMILLFGMLFRGLIVGLVASAPMGPVGVLCIQRTLNKGRWYGFVTGAGAALSDLVYALLTGFCMSFVVDFFEHQMFILQLVGSALLFGFGLYTYNSKPPQMHQPSLRKGTLTHNALTGLLVTLSNPLIIFLFVALFARFTFVIPGHPVEQGVGYLALLVGALLWWFGITYIVNNVRSRFNENGLKVLNRIIGIIVMVVALCGFCLTLGGGSLRY